MNRIVRIKGTLEDKGIKNKDGVAVRCLQILYPIGTNYRRETDIVRLVGNSIDVTLDDPQGRLFDETMEEQNLNEKNAQQELPLPPEEEPAEDDDQNTEDEKVDDNVIDFPEPPIEADDEEPVLEPPAESESLQNPPESVTEEAPVGEALPEEADEEEFQVDAHENF